MCGWPIHNVTRVPVKHLMTHSGTAGDIDLQLYDVYELVVITGKRLAYTCFIATPKLATRFLYQ